MKHLVFGGQYGSEGKGAVIGHLARSRPYDYAVRGGGPQAGHTFWLPDHGRVAVRQVPIGAFFGAIGYIGPGAVVDPVRLLHEIETYDLQEKVFVHPAAFCVQEIDREAENALARAKEIPGSTREGVGAARSRRALRQGPQIMPGYACVDKNEVIYRRMLEQWRNPTISFLIEGCQGYGLSLWHGQYPYVTSADTTPAAIMSECGLPFTRDLVTIAAIRTHPIRVGGDSGPLTRETSWAALDRAPEHTTVTGRERRVGYFDPLQFLRMKNACRPDTLALMFADYIDGNLPHVDGIAFEDVMESLRTWLSAVGISHDEIGMVGIGGDDLKVLESVIMEDLDAQAVP